MSEARISEIAPGGRIAPVKYALEEVVYVLQGRGVATVWADDGPKHSFEWNAHALFRVPGNHWVEYANVVKRLGFYAHFASREAMPFHFKFNSLALFNRPTKRNHHL